MKISPRLAAALLCGAMILPAFGCARIPPETDPTPPAVLDSAPPAAEASPSSVTVFIPAGDAHLLDTVEGARRIRDFTLIDTVAAEIPAAALDALAARTDLTVAAAFAAPAADAADADLDPDAADLVLRADDPLTGDGTVIAVIDAAFDVSHPAFAMPDGASPEITPAVFEERITDTNAAFNISGGKPADAHGDLYLSAKIPFAYDYAGRDGDVSGKRSDHGTHVAALAAAGGVSEDTLPGAAPAAQLLLMKVFSDAGTSCSEADILCAVEDAVLMGADVINLSLGILSADAADLGMPFLYEILAEVEARGVTVVAAAGNDGASGTGGADSDFMRTDNPDTGLPSEPAVFPTVIGVGAAVNAVYYAPYITAGEKRILYDAAAETETGEVPALSAALGGQSLAIVPVPGLGSAEDFADADVLGKIALIARGEIPFEEKVKNAAQAGAAAVIVYNSEDGGDFIMSVGGAEIPAVSVSYADGMLLAGMAGERVTVSGKSGAFPVAEADAVASYSARGPAADMTLSPDLAAVGSDVISAVTGGGYDAMTGTSMAAPQIAGLAAAYIADHEAYLSALPPEDRAAAVRAAILSAAEPILHAASGLPYSPRLQGAGRITDGADTARMTVSLTGEDGSAILALGDHLPGEGGSVTFTLRVTNTGTETETLTLTAVVTAEDYTERDGETYVTETPRAVPAEISFSADTVTAAPGESADITVTVTPDPAFLTAADAVFPNGFYLEGYVTAARGEEHAASVPFFGFCGNFDAAPMVDGGDWDGYESYYGGQALYLVNENGTTRAAGEDSARFAFSPDGDGNAESVLWELYPLRHIASCYVRVLDFAGEAVYEAAHGSALKTYRTDTGLTYSRLSLWDGTDGLNSHFTWPDGQYTAEITFTSFTGAKQTVTIPLTVDTAAPAITVTEADGTLTARASDGGTVYSLRIYAPDPDADADDETEEYLVHAVTGRQAKSVSLTAEIPAEAAYLYIRAEDTAGNVTLIRHYITAAGQAAETAESIETEEEIAA